MDDSSFGTGPTVVCFRPDPRFTALAGVGLVAALVVALLDGDAAGRLLAVVAAIVLAGYVGADLAFTPRLTASRDGLIIRSPFTRAVLAWVDVEDVRADSRLRLGLRTTTLEIDAGPVLVVFSRRTLGADPAEAAAQLQALRRPA